LTQYAGKEIVIARCIIREEHPDNDRFAKDCEDWFDHPITNLVNEKFDGSIYAVFEKRRYMAGIAGAPCTQELKKKVREEFQLPNDVHVFGYTAEEQDRYDHFIDANNVKCEAPLIERGLEHKDCLAMIQNAGIELPEMYKLGYKHNNCIGCVKATGAGYWNKIRKDFPVEFKKASKASLLYGARLIRVDGERCFLDELPEGIGNYLDEPEIQCGIFCHMAEGEYK
jgi:hypothetical protein